jgi:hypothetical protein
MIYTFLILRIILFFLITSSFSKVRKVLLLLITSEISLIILKKFLISFSTPYAGFGFLLFFINCAIFLFTPVYLLSKIKETRNEKSYLEKFFFCSYLIAILIFYPIISGKLLLAFFQIFYITLYCSGLLFFLSGIKKKISQEEMILLFFVLAGLIEIILVVIFGITNWWILQIGNFFVYMIVFLFGFILQIKRKI